MKYIISLALFVLSQLPYAGFAQKQLDKYLQYGLVNNESIKQQQFILDKNLYALQEAKSLFLPTVNFNTTYTLAGGGRTVDFPVGDLLNPVL